MQPNYFLPLLPEGNLDALPTHTDSKDVDDEPFSAIRNVRSLFWQVFLVLLFFWHCLDMFAPSMGSAFVRAAAENFSSTSVEKHPVCKEDASLQCLMSVWDVWITASLPPWCHQPAPLMCLDKVICLKLVDGALWQHHFLATCKLTHRRAR